MDNQEAKTRKICDTCKHDPPQMGKWPCMDCDMRDPADRWEPKDEQVAKILADILSGCPMLDPCSKIWWLEGWCKDHCKPGQQEPDSECWLKYAEEMVKEAENSIKSSLTQNTLDGTDINVEDMVSRRAAIDALMDEFKRVPTTAIRAKNRIDRLPSAQPERKTGRWLIRKGISDAQCSECKMYFSDVYDVENSDAFCRHCGAKMEGLKVVRRG